MMNEQTISDIIRGMQHAVNTAEDMLTAHQLEKLTEAFNEDGTPKMRFITLPDGRKVYIPLVSLTPSSNLTISELEMEFSVKVDNTITKNDGKNERSAFSVSFLGTGRKGKRIFGKDEGVIRIRMKFHEKEEPEAVARAREILDSIVQ